MPNGHIIPFAFRSQPFTMTLFSFETSLGLGVANWRSPCYCIEVSRPLERLAFSPATVPGVLTV